MKKETIAIRGNYKPENGEATTIPLRISTTYAYSSSDELNKLFSLEAAGHIYSRISNPTVSLLEEKIALLEGGVGCLATSSGHAAMANVVFNLCQAGDHIISSNKIYGGVYNLLNYTLPKYGITTTFVDPDTNLEELKKSVKENTKLIFTEVLSNPGLHLTDVSKFKKLAEYANVPYAVDNTMLTPILYKPFDDGADIVIHSGTKYFDGHGSTVCGFIIDSGKFNYQDNPKFKEFYEGDPSYHGVKYTESFGPLAFLIKARTQLTRDFGNYLSPFSAYTINQNLETLSLRIKQMSDNAHKLALYLEGHDLVEWVKYPLLKTNEQYEEVSSKLEYGSSIVAFNIKGSKEQAKKFADSLELCHIMAHFGDTRTGVIHPASTTHSQLSKEDLEVAGISETFIRVTVGLEHVDDIIADFTQALKQCQS